MAVHIPRTPGEQYLMVGARQGSAWVLVSQRIRDFGHNGTFDFTALFTDTQSFANVLCVGTNVFTLGLDPDLRFVRLQSYPGPVGEVKLYDKVESASLAESEGGPQSPASGGNPCLRQRLRRDESARQPGSRQ